VRRHTVKENKKFFAYNEYNIVFIRLSYLNCSNNRIFLNKKTDIKIDIIVEAIVDFWFFDIAQNFHRIISSKKSI